ncbi:hypothetical protein FOS05_13335 [Bacillus mycoides]|nr:hypothetical protein [Bacillus mycoides]TXR81271.1 hypothetical protein DN408_14115 [Bacillus sp. AR13-1]MDR4236077.1 hypothetical protein [Bacillus mycoides]MDR4302107.1 hypothetical protein [Bacillus mycoides]QWG81321.1 hypothetical protein EXW27_26365 [Bacillus mycoides]
MRNKWTTSSNDGNDSKIKKQLTKASCPTLQGGTRRKSNVMYSIDGILNFIQGGLIFKCNLGLVPEK